MKRNWLYKGEYKRFRLVGADSDEYVKVYQPLGMCGLCLFLGGIAFGYEAFSKLLTGGGFNSNITMRAVRTTGSREVHTGSVAIICSLMIIVGLIASILCYRAWKADPEK